MQRISLIVAILFLSTNIFTQASIEAAELTAKGIKHYESGDLDRALETFTKAIELSSKPKPHRSVRSNSLAQAADDAELRDRITFHDPVTAVAFLHRGHVHFARAKIDLAVADYSESLRLKPAGVEALCARSTALMVGGRAWQAVDDAQRAIKIDPKFARGHLVLAMAFQELGRTGEALSAVNNAIELDPKNAEAFFRRGDLHRLALRYDEALADYDRANNLDSDLASAYTGRGAIRFEQGRYHESIEHYSTALRLDPRLLQPMRFRGYAYLAIGRDDEAERDFARVLAIAPALREEIESARSTIMEKRKN